MGTFVLASFLAIAMVVLVCAIHYEAMGLMTRNLPKLPRRHRRLSVAVVVGGMFGAHVVEIWAFALCFWAVHLLGWGSLGGSVAAYDFWEYLYFAATSYTSLGLGEVFPTGVLRMLTGVAALAGLVMIAWTASLTYLVMEKFWRVGK